jgi:hypothetical protein
VSGYLGRIAAAKLTWPLPAALDDDAALERLLFPDEGHPVRKHDVAAVSTRDVGAGSATVCTVAELVRRLTAA